MKRLTAALGATCLSLCLLTTPGASMPVQAQAPTEEPGISPQSDAIRWIYKIEDGKWYKRLYNCTKGYWIGEWIFIRNAD